MTAFNDLPRKDFPIARRGYDPAAVDAYLERVAEKLQAEAERGMAPMATGISEQVKSILAAAEATAAELLSEAERDVAQMRSSAAADARQHVTRVTDTSSTLLSELSSLRERTQALLEEVEINSSALKDGLLSLREDVSSFRGEAAGDAGAQARTTDAEGDHFEAARDALTSARNEALQMARDGRSREEIDRHLEEHYELPDRASIVSEVVERAGSNS